MQHTAFDPPPPPPERPELPEGATPRWPAWYAGVGFLVALIATLVVVGILAAATGATADDEDPAFTIVATFLQGLIFIGTAVLFASFTRRPRPDHFGLRRTPFWPAVAWASLGIVTFYVLVAIYSVIVNPDAEQTEHGAVGLRKQQIAPGAKNAAGELSSIGKRLRAGAGAKACGLQLQRYSRADHSVVFQPRRDALGQSPEVQLQRPEIGDVMLESSLGGNALAFTIRTDDAVIEPVREGSKPPPL